MFSDALTSPYFLYTLTFDVEQSLKKIFKMH